MDFDKLFKILSYLAVFCGFLAVWVSGTFGMVGTLLFPAIMAAAWAIEGSRWQLSERIGTLMVVAAVPFYYVAWRAGLFHFADTGTMVAGMLGRLILSLSAIKLLQRKSDRDWIFLYLMAFFEVLLGAGLSISALYLSSFLAYIFVMVCAIIVFEIRRTGLSTQKRMSSFGSVNSEEKAVLPRRRLSLIGAGLLVCIIALAIPLFFLLPRVGGAGLGANPGGVSTSSGFSDSVRLGGVGNIQQSDEVVMRVNIETPNADTSRMKWRGIALDTFDNRSWSRPKAYLKDKLEPKSGDVTQVDQTSDRDRLIVQTVYLEPLDTPILFGLPRIIGVQGNFPELFRDKFGAISFARKGERISYRVSSDRALPSATELRADRVPLPAEFSNYLQVPDDLDPRVAQLADQVAGSAVNNYDAAKAIESHLQNDFGYTLEQRASGDQPLSDFLFNVREGHCEYFATAMAIMLRTRGIPTRIVNGFSQGEYNETADVWVIRQRSAHSWVEVYFPGERVWVPFDPTPFAGQVADSGAGGMTAKFNQYLEALQTFWIQYFVAFDNQGQRSLFSSVKRGMADYQSKTSSSLTSLTDRVAEWWAAVKGDKGPGTRVAAVGLGILLTSGAMIIVALFVWLYRKIVKLKVWERLWDRVLGREPHSIVEFYERMVEILGAGGMSREAHQTPLEFAYATGMPEAVKVTEKYNQVRFGEKDLSATESDEIEQWLEQIANAEQSK